MTTQELPGGEPLTLHVLLAALTDPVVLLDPVRDADGRVVDFLFAAANPAFDGFLGAAEGGSTGRLLSVEQQGTGTAWILERYVEVLVTGQPLRLDNVPRTAPSSGTLRYYDLRANRVGPYVGVTFRDVTRYVEATARLRESERRYRVLADNAGDLVFRSEHGVLTWVSPTSRELLGRAPDELVGRRGLELLLPQDRDRAAHVADALARDGTASYTARLEHADGSARWFVVNLGVVRDDDGRPHGEVGSARDISAEMEAREELADSEALFRSAMEASSVGMAILDGEGRFLAANPALCRTVRRERHELVGTALADLVHPDDRERVLQTGSAIVADGAEPDPREIRLLAPDGAPVWVRASAAVMPQRDGRPVSVISHFVDVTVEQEQRAELEYRALHDPLTGLYNRAWILDMLDNELRVAERNGETVAVLYIDLDNFKVINDSLGHAAGDEVLCAVARRIMGTLRARDYAARLGGDEFLLVGTDIYGPGEAEALAARVTRVINDVLEIEGHPLVIGASVGVALSMRGSTSASLLRDADSALFRAKANGRGRWQFFDDTMHVAAVSRLTTEADLRRGLAAGEFVPYYQPIVSLDPVRVTGYEALVRWNHPERGIVPPGDFLPVAEETGLVIDLGGQMLDQVCALIASRPDLTATFSVNKSPLQINRPEWRAHFLETVLSRRVDPRRLVIEVTESAVLSHIDKVADDLRHLRSLGVGLHVDDFGTGYSSIALLRDLPVTGIKLDRSFTEQLVDVREARVVAAGLSSLADGLDLVSIAEGVEEPIQAEILSELGWTHAQGYHYGRPQPSPATDLPAARPVRGVGVPPQKGSPPVTGMTAPVTYDASDEAR